MIDVNILNRNLERIHIIDSYKSLIWANRYNELGDCEISIIANIENLKIFQEGMFLSRDDDDMVCRIEKIELKTDNEDGDYLIITGYDVKKILYQRIVWNQINFNGLVENYIRKIINENIINPQLDIRKINKFKLGEKIDFVEKIRQQNTYENIGEKIEELCKKYNLGFKVCVDSENFIFDLYEGKDISSLVTFSDEYENLVSTDYTEDKTNLGNVALIAGEGEGVKRSTEIIGESNELDRYEIFVDARDLSKTVDYDELIKSYPDGQEIEIDGKIYYQVNGENIAIIIENDGIIEATLTDEIYKQSLIARGEERLTEYKATKSFDGEITPNMTFQYKEDYFLGDIVTIENKYGITIPARIIEVIEVFDENGYSVEPNFEYIEIGG